VGLQPAQGTVDALQFALVKPEVRAAEFAAVSGTSITNASTKFKQLWDQGFLLRQERNAESGGVEFLYRRIR
jgi:predicted transcriptional regulator